MFIPRVSLLLAIALFSSTLAHQGCIHDQVAVKPEKLQHAQVDPDTAGHRLLTANLGGIRIAFDLTNLQAPANIRNYIQYQLMPAAVNYFNQALKVPQLSNLKFSSQYLSQCDISLPAKYITQGIQADMLIMVEGAYDNAGFVAWARACATLDSTQRPIAGQVHFNFNGILPSTDADFTRDLLATMHEMTHALGFSSAMFDTYLNPVTTGTVNVGGYPTQYINVQPLTDRVRSYFGCPTAPGAYLENQGGSGSAGSHWERRVFGYEYMTASQLEDFRMSEITLALLESTGWYQVDYNMAEPLVWGKGKGCGFLNQYCVNSFGQAKFSEFCASGDGCTVGGRSGAYCQADSFSDNCPYMEAYANSDCENPASQSTIAAEVHGIGSKCFMSSLYPSGSLGSNRPMCFKRTCTNNGNSWQLSIQVGTQTINCQQAGPQAVQGYYGSIQCPDPNKYCSGDGQPYCRRGCMGKGTCSKNGTCQCQAGWGLYDCSRRTQSSSLADGADAKHYDYDNIPDSLATEYIPKN